MALVWPGHPLAGKQEDFPVSQSHSSNKNTEASPNMVYMWGRNWLQIDRVGSDELGDGIAKEEQVVHKK